MSYLKKLIVSSLLVLLGLCQVVAQNKLSAVSDNSKFLAVLNFQGKDKVTGNQIYLAQVYSVAYQSLIQDFKIDFIGKAEIDSVLLSPNGKMLYVYQSPEHRVYNVRTGKLVGRYRYPVRIAFATQGNFFVVSDGTTIKSLDSYTAEVLDVYQTAANNKVNELILSEDDAFLIANTDRKQLIFWKTGISRPIRKFYGDDVVFNKAGNVFTISRVTGTQLSTYTYQFPDFRRLTKQSVDKALRDYARAQTLALRKANPQDRSQFVLPSKLILSGFSLSNIGNYLAFYAQNSNEAKVLYVMNTANGNILLENVLENPKKEMALSWYNDSLLIPKSALEAGVFNARQASFEQNLDLEIFKEEGRIKAKKQVNNRVLSSDFTYTALNQDKELAVKMNLNALSQQNFSGFEGLSFSPDSKRLFVFDANKNAYGYLTLNSENKPFPLLYFSNQKRTFTEEAVVKEQLPANWNYKQIQGFKDISTATQSDSVQLLLKSVETGKKAGLQVQLIDKQGNYYYGAASPLWKKVWCNLMVKGSDGKVRQIEKFTVSENRLVDSLSNAIAVAMDFSGSMGWDRADVEQDGVLELIKSKNPSDVMSLLKYDDKIQLESRAITDVAKLSAKLFRNDFSYFGGATALLDAINAAIFSIKNEEVAGKKIVIVMTDGFENASLSTRNELLANALQNGVSIYTIAFGDLVDNDFLKSLSYNTKGGHYQIFRTKDLKWVFSDIYKKASNYYTVSYANQDPGDQIYLLKLCIDTVASDSVVVKFNNTPADLRTLLASDDNYKESPVIGQGMSLINSNEFNFPNRNDFTNVLTEGVVAQQKLVLKEDKLTAIEDEFAKIKLPKFNFYYDEVKTVQETEIRILDVVNFMKKYPTIRLAIVGHTDNTGTTSYNDDLSLRRATIVRDLIVKKGIPAKRFEIKGFGENAPLATNNTEEGRAINRRVEFLILNESE